MYVEYFTRVEDFAEVQSLLVHVANENLPHGTRVQLMYNPDPCALYGKVVTLALACGEECDTADRWDCTEEGAPLQPMTDGTFLVMRGRVPCQNTLPYSLPMMLKRRALRVASVERILAAAEALSYE